MTTHVFIVNTETFPAHLQYLFAGTGAGEKDRHIGLLADIERVRKNDYVVFYLEKVGFFGIFQIDGKVFKDTSTPAYLREKLKKKLIYRVKIKPHKVYPNYVSEWEAIDKLPLYSQDVIWSLIYRKLKGNRGCTPINLQESERLIKMIENKNNNNPIPLGSSESFTYRDGKIIRTDGTFNYTGPESSTEDILSEMIEIDKENRLQKKNKKYEDRLQVYFTENIGRGPKLGEICGKGGEIIWMGNEVACGVGMQKIDIFTITSDKRENKQFNLVELKCAPAYPEIIYQLQRYVDWTSSYIKGAINSNIQPVVVTRRIVNGFSKRKKPLKVKIERDKAGGALRAFNSRHIAKKVRWFEFDFVYNDLVFEEINYV